MMGCAGAGLCSQYCMAVTMLEDIDSRRRLLRGQSPGPACPESATCPSPSHPVPAPVIRGHHSRAWTMPEPVRSKYIQPRLSLLDRMPLTAGHEQRPRPASTFRTYSLQRSANDHVHLILPVRSLASRPVKGRAAPPASRSTDRSPDTSRNPSRTT